MALMLVVGCKPSIPKGIISPGDMEDILYDYHLARAMSNYVVNNDSREFNETMYFQAMLKKHDVTEAEFDSSLVYYYSRADQFAEIALGDTCRDAGKESRSDARAQPRQRSGKHIVPSTPEAGFRLKALDADERGDIA